MSTIKPKTVKDLILEKEREIFKFEKNIRKLQAEVKELSKLPDNKEID